MQPLRDFLVKADIQGEYEVELNGRKIFIDPDFNPLHRRVQKGEVHTLPKQYKGDVQVGDECWFHHFVVTPDNCYTVNGVKTYACSVVNLWLIKRDGELIPQNDLVFCTQVFEPTDNYKTKSGIWLKATPDKIPYTVRVDYVSEAAHNYGLRKGQLIVHTKGVDYTMKVDGKELIQIDYKYLLAERDGFADYSVKEMHEARY